MKPEHWMRRALELAARGRGWVNPNPLVGAVIVKDGQLVGQGFHKQYGTPHAEANALDDAGDAARGADLYVNVEPCVHHHGKRTPPCTDRIIQSGIRRVFIAMHDPDEHVHSRGIAQLRQANIEVYQGMLESEARRLNEISQKYKTTGKPFVLLKMAMSADGKIATRTGHAKYISSAESLRFAHELRDRYAAILVGIETVLSDDPSLNTRLDNSGHDPVRIILDSQGRISLDAKVLRLKTLAPTILVTTERITTQKESALRALGAEVLKLPATQGCIDLTALLDNLGRRGLDSILVEGGSTVSASFLETGLVDKITFVMAPILIGGQSAPSPIGGAGIETIQDAYRLKNISIRTIGSDLIYEAYLEKS
jgi:diaminohydroxyphosphoribosylaminopyrimidine deaminase/5-amino-6-(5-phosphoribosylamino)uracil reductase